MDPKYIGGKLASCVLTKKERKALNDAHGVADQLAYHYAGTDRGGWAASAAVGLAELTADPEICPATAEGEQTKEGPDAHTN